MKKNTLILFMLSIISGMLIFGKTVYACESNSTVTTQYVMYDELTPAEKGKVTQGQPNIEVLHDQENIKLIYTKIIEHSKSSDSNNIKNTSINENTIFKNTDILPKTGENNHNIYWILGIILIFLLIILLIWKRKKAKTLLLLFLLAAGVISSVAVNAEVINLPIESVQNLPKNGKIFSPNTAVETYEYVGYIHTYSDNELPIKKGNVTVKYQDEDGNALSDDVTLTGNVCEQYSTEKKDIEGYIFRELQGNTTGSFTGDEQTVIFVYELEEKEGLVEFVLNDQTREKTGGEIIVWERGERKSYPTLYYIWDKDDLNSKITDLSLNGKVGTPVSIPTSYDNLFQSEDGTIDEGVPLYQGTPVYAVYQDELGELHLAPEYYNFYASLDNFYANLDNYDNKPSLYTSDTQIINFYIHVFVNQNAS